MRGTVDFYRLLGIVTDPLFGAPFRATLVFVYHRLGDLLRIGPSSFHFTTSLVLHRNSQGPQTFLFLRPSASLQTPCIAQVLQVARYTDIKWIISEPGRQGPIDGDIK